VLFKHHKQESAAIALGGKVFEFSQFLVKENLVSNISGRHSAKVGFHNSCHSFRELGIIDEPLNILKQIRGLEVLQPPGEPVCCGFGGLFSFKYEHIAETMAKSRLQQFIDIGVKTVITNDPGCMMHLNQEAKSLKMGMKVIHLATFLEQTLTI
jgi:L-lactate dehydrogenase complex protein LldE